MTCILTGKYLKRRESSVHNGRMECITGRDTVQAVFRHILQNSATEGNIDDLHALADPDHRDPGGNGCVKGLKLQDVQFGVNSAGTFVFSPKKAGVISPPPGRIRASQEVTSPGTSVVTVLAGSFEKNVFIIARLGTLRPKMTNFVI